MRQVNPKMPLVIITCPGMVSNGFAESLERPGGIYTGMDELPPGVTRKRLQLLKRAAPAVSRIALLSTTPGRGGQETQLADAEQTAKELGVSVKAYRAGLVPTTPAPAEDYRLRRRDPPEVPRSPHQRCFGGAVANLGAAVFRRGKGAGRIQNAFRRTRCGYRRRRAAVRA
jgi:hypothetical protein